MKLPSFLALILILFLSLSVVSASENIHDVTNTSDGLIDNSASVTDSNENVLGSNENIYDDDLGSNLDDSQNEDSFNESNSDVHDSNDEFDVDQEDFISNGDENQEDTLLNENLDDFDDSSVFDVNMDDEIVNAGLKKVNKLSSSLVSESEEIVIGESEPIIINGSTYSKYFDSNGKIKSGTLKDGDTIKIKNISDKVFTINVRLNIISDDGDKLTNCIIRLIEGSSGSYLNNLCIVNTKEKASRSNYYLSGISIINSANNIISNSTINVSVHKCFAIMMSNASHNRIIGNTIISGLSSTIPMTASSYNEIRDNYIESEYTNMIYQSLYGNGDFMPIDGGVSSGNIIANNYLKSRNGTYNSYCYAIYLMQSVSGSGAVIANNTLENVFHAIYVESSDALVYNNTISNVGGPAAILVTGDNITVSCNNVSTEYTDVHDWNDDGNVVAIKNGGKNNLIVNNTLRSNGSNTIVNTGVNVVIANNTVYTESANCINTTKSNVVIENNTLIGINSSAVMIVSSKLVENITIRNNDIYADNSAIVLRGNVSYALVCDNIINVSEDSDAIAILKYTNRNPITPSHYAIYNNTINNVIVNMTDPSEIERDDISNGSEGNGSSGNGSAETGNGTYSDEKINTTIYIVDTNVYQGSYFDIFLKDINGNPICGVNVVFHIFNKDYIKTTDSEGKANLQFNANVGNYTMNVSYVGNDDYNPCKVPTNVSVIRHQFIVREDNFHTCFDNDGYLKPEYANYDLIFKGTFRDKRIILNAPVNLKSDGAKLLDSVIKVESDGVSVEGFTIINSNPGNVEDNHRFAILLDNVKGVRITNNSIQLNSYDNGYGIFVSESSNSKILNNTIKVKAEGLAFAIMLYDSKNNTIKRNDILVNGTSKPHLYDSSIKVDSSISVDDPDAVGMDVPEVYKTYGIILFYSSSNDIGYNKVTATSGVTKYYTAIQESTNSIVGIDLYYESNNNKVHHNDVNVSAKDPYLYGLGVLGAETGHRDQVSANNSFTDNKILVNGTYYSAGIIAGYNSINTTMLRNKINCISTNVSYGAILEGADNTDFNQNNVSTNSRVNYLVEGYDADNNKIGNNYISYGDKSLFVRGVALYNSNNNLITNNSLPSYDPLIPRIVNEINRIWKMKNPDSPITFTKEDILYDSPSSPIRVVHNGTEYDLIDLLDFEPTSHPDVIPPGVQGMDDIGGKNNTFEGNPIRDPTDGEPGGGTDSGGNGSGDNGSGNGGSGGTNSGNSDSGNSNSGSSDSNGSNSNDSNSNSSDSNGTNSENANKSNGTESGDTKFNGSSDASNEGNSDSGERSDVNGDNVNSNSTNVEGNTVGVSSSAPVTESANAYNLNVDEDMASAAARSLSLGGMNAPALCIILLLIFACSAELIKRSRRDLK